jgi:hypothetical protein
MQRPLKIAINVLASLFVIVLGTVQAAQAKEVWLDFSVPQPNSKSAAPTRVSDDEAVATASSSQPSALNPEPSVVRGANQSAPSLIATANSTDAIAIEQTQKTSENAAKLIALDFSVPTANSASTSVALKFPTRSEPSQLDLTPPPSKSSSQPPLSSASKTPAAITKSKQVTALRRAIIGQESGGKFWIVNPHSGALGYGQLMPENVAPWSRAALGREVSRAEFLNNPDIQLKVIDHKLSQYLDQALQVTGGDRATAVKRVAATWYSGNPNLYTSTVPQFYNGYLYPSIAAYSESVLYRYQQQLHK